MVSSQHGLLWAFLFGRQLVFEYLFEFWTLCNCRHCWQSFRILLIPCLGSCGTQRCSFFAAAMCLLACSVVKTMLPSKPWLGVVCAVAGRMFLDICFVTVFHLSIEHFPASCRSTAVGICCCFSRMTAFVAPLCGRLPVSMSCAFFAGACLLASLASCWLPEVKTDRRGCQEPGTASSTLLNA